jgi:hypothetical protein
MLEKPGLPGVKTNKKQFRSKKITLVLLTVEALMRNAGSEKLKSKQTANHGLLYSI